MEGGAHLGKLENMVHYRVKACSKSDLRVKMKLVKEKEEIYTFLLSLMGPIF